MLVIPAIDLRDGKCVRLKQGDYSQETIYSDFPWKMALDWANQGAQYLHLVDLDGAKTGRIENSTAIKGILDKVKVPCELGGGIRDEKTVSEALSWGIDRVIIGTKAIHDPQWLYNMAIAFPGKIALGIDAKDGKIAVAGWLEVSQITVEQFLDKVNDWPLAAIIYTDISKDGMLSGPNVETTSRLASKANSLVIASGGVSTTSDIKNLKVAGVKACIVGKALYDSKMTLSDALDAARS
ncbi:MAG: 1-(5-phosphoribosyl)-5-[(5-phosphoribosylamino)methylideneamino]imidazole-4-carboxamide isomerase [Planctomycetota bacterium]|nr:1-(5-phosphoribosyl)-5-[(5-phosphoribosylamino)methylideneamino]imidazole-4-carboxamide isomerase [Planctomycetota bacterium]